MSEGEVRDYRSVGEILRQARQTKQWSVAQVSEVTRIAPRIIEAIEHDDLGQVANPIYARGFIRSLALALDLDADWVLSKVDLRDGTSAAAASVPRPTPAKTPLVPPTAPAPSERGPVWQVESVRVRRVESAPRAPLPWSRMALGAAVLVILGAVLWWGPRLLPDRNSSSVVDSEAPATPWPTRTDSAAALGAGTDPVVGPVDERPEGSTGAVPVPEAAGTAGLEAVGTAPEVRSLPSVITPDPQSRRQLTLLLRARRQVDVVLTVDGQEPRRRALRAGETWGQQARDHFALRVTDPGAIEVDLDGVRRSPPPDWTAGVEWLLYPLPDGRGDQR